MEVKGKIMPLPGTKAEQIIIANQVALAQMILDSMYAVMKHNSGADSFDLRSSAVKLRDDIASRSREFTTPFFEEDGTA